MIGNLHGFYLQDKSKFLNSFVKYNYISDYFCEIIKQFDVPSITIEGYSMNSMGQVFNIAENTMLLKYKLKMMNKTINIVAPTQLKKFATSKRKR